MKKRTKVLCAAMTATVAAGSVFALAACQKPLTDEPLTGSMLADFTDGEAAAFFASDGWSNGEPFNVTWDADNVAYDGGAAKLSIAEAADTAEIPYLGGELRSYQYFGYGDYTVRMKPAKIAGTASTFFTCTGPYDTDDEGNPNPHDEIDIEFLGKDTTKVQFNYFVNGEGGHEYMYDLGFDASEEFHDYGYRWAEDHIVWFVDGKPVYKVEKSDKNPMPSTPGRILMNYWCGTEAAEEWMGEYTGSNGATVDYVSVKTSATPITKGESSEFVKIGENEAGLILEGAYSIEMSDANTVMAVDYEDILGKSYNNITANISEFAEDNNVFTVTIKNEGEETAKVRIDMVCPTKNGTVQNDGSTRNPFCNIKAEYTGNVVDKGDDYMYGGADWVKIAAGETITAKISFYSTAEASAVRFYIDSSTYDDETTHTGRVDFSDMNLTKEEIEEPELPDPVETPTVKIGANDAAFTGNYPVSISDDKSSMTIEYADILGSSYNNISASIKDFAADNNTFTVTIKNEGADTAKIRMDIKCAAGKGLYVDKNNGNKCDFINVKAEYSGNIVESGNDYDYGGADWVKIAAGETVTITITFDSSNAAAESIMFYIDSSTWDDNTNHSGKLIFSNMNLSKEEIAATPDEA